MLVFQSRPGREYRSGGRPPAFAVRPSYIGAQRVIESIHAERMGWPCRATDRREAQRASRAALTAALAVPPEAAPREPHAAGLLGSEG
jgi:hypothetical protein